MEHVIQVVPRDSGGKGAARKLRASGKIPGILYGHQEKPVSFSVDPVELGKNLRSSGMGRNTVLKVQGLARDVLALLKDAQVHPVMRKLVHIDLVEVRDTDRVVVEVPVDLLGKPAGVVNGGILQVERRAIALECSPLSIPKQVSIDVSSLNIGQSIHMDDLTLPPGTKSGYSGNFTIATVQAPKAEVEVVATPVEGVEGVAAAVGEGGATAAGAAAAAPAEADKKSKEKGKEKGKEKSK